MSTITSSKPTPWLDTWREKWGELAERKTKIANAIGTAFHDCIERYLDDGTSFVRIPAYPSCRKRVESMMYQWIKWAQQIDGTIDQTEFKVVSRMHVYSGTLDAVGRIGKTPMLVDWKTSSRIYPDMDLQLAAYAHAYNEMTGSKIKDGLIVHVSKDKPDFKLTTKHFKLGKRPFARFMKLREMFDDMNLAPIKETTDAETTVDETSGC